MMKRSSGDTLYSNPEGYMKAKQGLKTCTSRHGIRKNLEPGSVVDFTNNETEESFPVVVTGVFHKKLKDLEVHECWAINNYEYLDAVAEFTEIYTSLGKEVDENTDITLVWFRRL